MTQNNTLDASDASFCAKCSRLGKTCCQDSDVYVTQGDLLRIKTFTGHSKFFEYRAPSDPSYRDQSDDPVWDTLVFKKDGSRRVLCRDAVLNCIFLGQTGCFLPMDVRPLICRLHPFQYTVSGLEPDLAAGCPLHLLAPGITLEAQLKLSRITAEKWHKLLYAEIIKEAEDENRINL
jgi:Fe-S-cluster containining protein